MTNEELKQLVREALVEVLEEAREEVDEVSTTSAVSGYNIPKAFVKKKLKAKDKKDESKMNEASYRDFRKDPRPNARKIGEAIKHVNFKLREIDTLLRHSGKLKREAQKRNRHHCCQLPGMDCNPALAPVSPGFSWQVLFAQQSFSDSNFPLDQKCWPRAARYPLAGF